MPISIIIQLHDPLSIENKLKWTKKLRQTILGEPSKYEQWCIPWKCWYLCQPLCHRVNILDKNCHIFTSILGYTILIKVLEDLLERSDNDVTHIEHFIQSNLEVCISPLLKHIFHS